MPSEILNISNLCVSYSDENRLGTYCERIINNFSLTLARGEKIIICGTNGSGKTTLLRCILGSKKPDSGTVKKYTDNIAYCKQNFSNTAFPISAKEVVEMGLFKKSSDTDVLEAMKLTGTEHLANRAFFTLSGGERQRVSLARCFCQKAELFLLDEPTSFLDVQSFELFINLMKTLPDCISVIIVTHDTNLIKALSWNTVPMGGF